MSAFQPFGYKGEEDTCLWCGRPLRKERLLATTDEDQRDPTYKPGKTAYAIATIEAKMPGYMQNGHFDTQGCGFRWAVQMADLGERLELNS